MVTATALDLLKISAKMAGVLAVGQTPVAEDANDQLVLLNAMLASWTQDRWMIYHLRDIACPSTGAQTYTIGPGGSFNAPRPDSIESGYVRMLAGSNGTSGPIDFPLTGFNTFEEYAMVGIKSLTSFPATYFYDPTLVLGTLYLWPVPSDQFEIHLIVKDVLPQFTHLSDVINLPPEYYDALIYNMAARIQLLYQLQPSTGIVVLARRSLNTISVANNRVPMLQMPSGLTRSRGRGWNPNNAGGFQEGVFTLDEDVLG